MNQIQFEEQYRADWDEFVKILDQLEAGKQKQTGALSSFPDRYRRLCNHYGLAQTRHYSPNLVEFLHHLVLRGHRQLYKKKGSFLYASLNFVLAGFPRLLRKNIKVFWIAFLLFYGPAICIGVATYSDPVLLYSIIPEGQVAEVERMYDPSRTRIGALPERDSESDFRMFGFYILNNISIGFRTFAGGILFGVGSVFLLLYNGMFLGGVAGHLSHPPFSTTFWQFVLGHGAFELTAIVVSGAAGLSLGYGLLRPGQYKRTDALRMRALPALQLVLGASLMLLIAAFIEAFWSSSTIDPNIKYLVAAINWTLVGAYLAFGGRWTR